MLEVGVLCSWPASSLTTNESQDKVLACLQTYCFDDGRRLCPAIMLCKYTECNRNVHQDMDIALKARIRKDLLVLKDSEIYDRIQ